MGVYIKGMKMPKSCFECDLYNDESNFCKAQKEYMPFASFGRDYKDADCPMVEVSEPHGRLIDADTVIEKLAKAIPYIIGDDVTNAYVEGLGRAKIETEDSVAVIELEGEP